MRKRSLYEIDMVRFAGSRLLRGKWESEKDQWARLESFLVHYRNLIEFLGKDEGEIRAGDLHVSNIWKILGVQVPPDFPRIRVEGAKLWTKYERVNDRISRYLQHCTTQRTQVKSWEVGTMNRELESVLPEVEKALRSGYESWSPEPPVVFLGPAPRSTATVTTFSSLLQSVDLPPPGKSK
jgi:hypothetical protein